MGRKLEFDRDKALTRATRVFWKHGYVNTSMARLQKAMKLGEGSIYNAFKSKKALYLECLEHYNATFMGERNEALRSSLPARERIAEFFDVVICELSQRAEPGCLVSNSLSHEVLSQREMRSYLFERFDSFLEYLRGVITDGQERGEVRVGLDPDATARVLFTYLHGLNRLSVYRLDAEARKRETTALIEAIVPEP